MRSMKSKQGVPQDSTSLGHGVLIIPDFFLRGGRGVGVLYGIAGTVFVSHFWRMAVSGERGAVHRRDRDPVNLSRNRCGSLVCRPVSLRPDGG